MKPPENRGKPHGGKRKGAGRRPDWLKKKCCDLVDKNKLVEFLSRVADGSESFMALDKLGRAVEIGPEIKDRLRAVEMLLDRGFGKAIQGVEHSGSVATTYNLIIEGVDANR